MKKGLKNLVKGGIETIILIVVMVAIVIGLFISVVLPMVNTTDNLGASAQNNLNKNTEQWMAGNFN